MRALRYTIVRPLGHAPPLTVTLTADGCAPEPRAGAARVVKKRALNPVPHLHDGVSRALLATFNMTFARIAGRNRVVGASTEPGSSRQSLLNVMSCCRQQRARNTIMEVKVEKACMLDHGRPECSEGG